MENYLVRELRVTRRSVLASSLTLIAILLMVVSTILFSPAPRSTNPPLLEATAAAFLGGIALFFALRLSGYKAELQQVSQQALQGGRAQWFLIIPGLALLALGTEMSANVLKTETLPFQTVHVQFATLFLGLLLFMLGMIGIRRISLPHLDFREILPVAAIVVFAFFVRGYGLISLFVSQ